MKKLKIFVIFSGLAIIFLSLYVKKAPTMPQDKAHSASQTNMNEYTENTTPEPDSGNQQEGEIMMYNKDKAGQLLESVLSHYRKNNTVYYLREYYPIRENEVTEAYLWSYFGALGMMYQMNRLFPDDPAVKEEYKNMLDNLAYYKNADSNDTWAKYNSGRGTYHNTGKGDIFFDDNIWVARNMLFAYEIFGDEMYLNEAIKVTNYVYTGWNQEISGLVWNENGLGEDATTQELERGLSANACSIMVSAELYQLTKEENYLDWALKFYDFCKQMQDKDTGIYYNGIHTIINEDGTRSNGTVNKDLYAYNPGSMIIADLILYDITGEDEYYQDAKKAAKASADIFLKTQNNIAYYEGYPWFSAILMEAYEVLSRYDKEFTAPFYQAFQDSLDYAWTNYRDQDGLLPSNPAAGFHGYDGTDRQLLTQAAIAEIYALLALLD